MTRTSVLRGGPAWIGGFAWLVAAAGGLVGCASQNTDSGELGQASLLPSCATCTYGGAPLAVGASQPLDPKGTFGGTRGVTITLRAVDPQVATADALTLRAVAPGVTAVVALTPQNRVLDFFNLTTVTADQLGLSLLDSDGEVRGEVGESVTWLIGDDRTLRVVPRAGTQQLAGQLDATFAAASAAVTIVPGIVAGEWRVIARQAGTVPITISALGITRTLTVEILP